MTQLRVVGHTLLHALAALPPSLAVGRKLLPALAALPPSLAVGRKLLPAFAAFPPSLAVVLLVAFGAAPAGAHHSWSRYDGDHVITVEGNITEIAWASPHVVIQFTVPEEGAEPTAWTMEMDPPTLLNRYGLRHDTLKPGMHVKLTGVRAKSGAPMMRAVTVEVDDGTVYRVSSRV